MTAQFHERLILNGEETSMAFNPPLPEKDPRIVSVYDNSIDGGGLIFSTACWRGYVGTWQIEDDKFYLVHLNGNLKLVSETRIFADWFTGTIRIPKGEILHYIHMGYASVFEEELLIKIEKGIVTKSKIIDNRNKRINESDLVDRNFPGSENKFDGDDEL